MHLKIKAGPSVIWRVTQAITSAHHVGTENIVLVHIDLEMSIKIAVCFWTHYSSIGLSIEGG